MTCEERFAQLLGPKDTEDTWIWKWRVPSSTKFPKVQFPFFVLLKQMQKLVGVISKPVCKNEMYVVFTMVAF